MCNPTNDSKYNDVSSGSMVPIRHYQGKPISIAIMASQSYWNWLPFEAISKASS